VMEGAAIIKLAALNSLAWVSSKREQCKIIEKLGKGYGFLYGLSYQRGGGYNFIY
jgi:hypothetical protein